MKIHILNIIIIIFFLVTAVFSREKQGQLGLVFMDDLSSEPLKYGILFWPTNKLSLELLGSYENIDVKENSGTAFNLGIGGLYHFGQKETLPYVGSRLIYYQLSNGTDKFSDQEIDLVFGLDYYLYNWMSMGGEIQFCYLETDPDFSVSGNVADATIIKTKGMIVLRFLF